MTVSLPQYRIETIDLLKGLVMIVMALDHVRDYFHAWSFLHDPTDPLNSNLPIFFTRFITHFCAPGFCFLAGLSAFMVGKRKSRAELSGFLFKRGLWLVFIELTIVNLGWFFDIQFRNPMLLVIWSLGISMIVLAGLVHLPRKIILLFSVLVIFGHNLLDTVHFENNLFWSILHEPGFFPSLNLFVGYPIIPWIAVMSLGYCFGVFYDSTFNPNKRKQVFNIIGMSALLLFIILRFTNVYGDAVKYIQYDNLSQCIISFFNPSKYPPSLLYLLMTLGTMLIFLANSENLKGKVVNFFATFGRVPLFYYIAHLYLIHLLALLATGFSGYDWDSYILTTWMTESSELKGFGFSLWVVYAVWIAVILMLYPICKKFDTYKQYHKEKWWLSYL
jgi:uncharacterized membrane protein